MAFPMLDGGQNACVLTIPEPLFRHHVGRTCVASCSQISSVQEVFSRFSREARRIAFPGDVRVLEHVETVGMRHSKRDVLLSKQHANGCRLSQSFEITRY